MPFEPLTSDQVTQYKSTGSIEPVAPPNTSPEAGAGPTTGVETGFQPLTPSQLAAYKPQLASRTPLVPPKPTGIFSKLNAAIGSNPVLGPLNSFGGAIEGAAKAIGQPFTRVMSSAKALTEGLGTLASAGAAYLSGKKDAASKIIESGYKQQQKELAGPIESRPVTTPQEAVGVGAQLGATAFAPTAAGFSVAAGPVPGAVAGGAAGALYGGGSALEQSGAQGLNASETINKVGTGTVIGAVTGAVSGALLGALSRGLDMHSVNAGESAQTNEALQPAREALAGDNMGPGAMNPEETAKANQVLQEALKQGYSVKDIDLITGASEENQNAFDDMVQMAKKARLSSRAEKPIELVGQPLVDALGSAEEARKAAGAAMTKALDAAAGENVDMTEQVKPFLDGLFADGVTLKDGELDFSNSAYKDLPDIQKSLTQGWHIAQPGQNGETILPLETAHNARMGLRLSNDIQAGQGMLKGRPQTLLEQLYNGMGSALDAAAPGYGPARMDYAQAMTALEDGERLLGGKFVGAPAAIQDLRAGEIANRLQSNASANVMRFLSELDKVVPGVQADVTDRAAFNTILEDAFGLTGERTLRGQVGKAGIDAAAGIAKDAATTNWIGALRGVISATMGKTPAMQRAALESLVQRLITAK